MGLAEALHVLERPQAVAARNRARLHPQAQLGKRHVTLLPEAGIVPFADALREEPLLERRGAHDVRIRHRERADPRHDLAKLAREVETASHEPFQEIVRPEERRPREAAVVVPRAGIRVHARDVDRGALRAHRETLLRERRRVDASGDAPCVRAEDDGAFRGVDPVGYRHLRAERAREEVRHLLRGEPRHPLVAPRIRHDDHFGVLRCELKRACPNRRRRKRGDGKHLSHHFSPS